ncbi:MAG TPA: hypothetical protein VMG12_40205 [Polyangiaceae bacterium]|nr:hypothetical protein [Polyangiaceae bacterium]
MRYGILAKGRAIPAWAAECVERLDASGHAALSALIVVEAPSVESERRRPATLPRIYRELWLERRSLALRRVELGSRRVPQRVVSLPAAASLDAGDAALAALGELGLDFILLVDALPMPRSLDGLARFGVWSLSQADRAAPCLREVLEGQPTTRVALERRQRGRVAVLHEGAFATCRASWTNNIDRTLLGAADFCVRVCAEIVHDGGARLEGLPEAPRDDDRTPVDTDIVRLLAKSAERSAAKLWELLFHLEIWNVGFAANSVAEILRDGRVDASGVTWCKPHQPGHFIADPFPFVDRGKERVLVEDYDQIKGKISSIDPADGRGGLALTPEFDLPYHLSYPCIFEEGGETYCVSEAYQSNRASLYRRSEQGWSLVRHLIDGLPIVDPTLFKHDGRYWLLFTLQNDGAWGNQKLYAYHAPALDAAWVPHVLNPVKCDIAATRPAGSVFRVGERLFRPSQDCSTTYGAAVVINELVELSPSRFLERVAARIEPIADGPYPDGLHTLNAMGDRAVFDSKKFAFDWLAWRKNWGRLHEVLR